MFTFVFLIAMPKNSNKRERLNSLKARVENQKIGDVTLAEFADSKVPSGKGRLRKSKNVLSEVRQISNVDDVTVDPSEVDDLVENLEDEIPKDKAKNEPLEINNNDFTEYPLKIWLLVAEYIDPEDIKTFSLICRATQSVVNTPLFWIRLYKRYYRKKIVAPKCLSLQCLDIRLGLKQRVVRSLYYFYPPFAASIKNRNPPLESVTGTLCLLHWTQSAGDKESSEGCKWIYNIKLCNRNANDIFNNRSYPAYWNNINHNLEKGCMLLKIIWNEFVVLPSLVGMRLRSIATSPKAVTLKFSSAPLSKIVAEAGLVTVRLEHSQSPRLIPWWHPDYWEHNRCCRAVPSP